MENRKITIVSTKNQSKTVITTNASTLGELKAVCGKNGIDYTGMTWYEGTSKVELKDDMSVLPHDVPWKGTTTNELVFMLTNTNKKIKSGATITTRKEAGAFFKVNPDKATEFKKVHSGKNWTNCSTADILEFINGSTPKVATKKESKAEVEESAVKVQNDESVEVVDINCRAAVKRLINVLYDNEYLEEDEKCDIEKFLGGRTFVEEGSLKSPYSDSDIDHMFDFVK